MYTCFAHLRTCALVCVRASISWKLLRTPSLAPCIPRALLSWIDAHFSIFAIKRPCRRGVDAKERNYMDHFDGRKKKKRKESAHPMERPGNAIAARNGDFQRRARWLNKLRRSLSVFFSFTFFFFFLYWIIYKLILASFLICRKFLMWTHAAFCSILQFYRKIFKHCLWYD